MSLEYYENANLTSVTLLIFRQHWYRFNNNILYSVVDEANISRMCDYISDNMFFFFFYQTRLLKITSYNPYFYNNILIFNLKYIFIELKSDTWHFQRLYLQSRPSIPISPIENTYFISGKNTLDSWTIEFATTLNYLKSTLVLEIW